MPQLRFGFIGAGAIAHISAKAVGTHEQASIVAVQDVNASRAKDLAGAFEIPKVYGAVEQLLADKNVDAVYIGVPNKFHAPLAEQALNAGKHVLLDKPFAMNLDEARQVAAAAERSGKLLMLGMNQRYREDSQKIRTLVEQGVLGDVYHAKAYWFRRSGIPRMGTWFGNKELAGGGALLDIGVHLLDLALYTMDNFKPVSVSGATYTRFGNRGLGEGGWGKSDREDIAFDVDDFASALIKMENGASVTLDVSWACHTDNPALMDVRMFGDEGGASLFPARIFRNDPMREEYDIVEKPRAEIAYPHCDRFHNFINAVLHGEPLCATVTQSLAVQQILDGIYESCRTGREVRLEELAIARA